MKYSFVIALFPLSVGRGMAGLPCPLCCVHLITDWSQAVLRTRAAERPAGSHTAQDSHTVTGKCLSFLPMRYVQMDKT